MQPVINVEVAVPRIVLPTVPEKSEAEDTNTASEEMVEVHLLPISMARSPSPVQQSNSIKGEASTYAAQKSLFHLFRIKDVTTQGRVFLLQVLRKQRKNSPRKQEPMVTDEMPFRVDYKQQTNDENSASVELIPGLTQVTIILSEEDTPSTYSIDGAES